MFPALAGRFIITEPPGEALKVFVGILLQYCFYFMFWGVFFGHETCGIFPDQGLNPCLLHWQTDSLPLTHHGSHPYFNRTLIFRTILDLLQY